MRNLVKPSYFLSATKHTVCLAHATRSQKSRRDKLTDL